MTEPTQFKWPVQPGPDVDLYSLAMGLRGAADGSMDLCADGEDLRHNAAYLQARLDVWGKSGPVSEQFFLLLLRAVLREVRDQAPWMLEPHDG